MTEQRETARVQHEQSRENQLMGIMVIIVRVLTGKGVNNSAAVMIAMDIIKELTASYGGVDIYISKKETVRHAQRAAAILSEFDGKNHALLAKKYGITSRQIYSVVGRKIEPKSKKPNVAWVAELLKRRQEKG